MIWLLGCGSVSFCYACLSQRFNVTFWRLENIMNNSTVFQSNIELNSLLIDIATPNVISLLPSDSLGDAAHIMAGKRISSLVVTDKDNHPVGIITERNVLHAMQSGSPPETLLQVVMSSPVITVNESMPCLDAYQVCLRDGIRHLVIVDAENHLLGLVSETDFRLHINLSTLAGRRQIASVMNSSVFSLPPEACLQDALNLMQSHRDTCIVLVEDQRPVGIITERDIVRLYSGGSVRTDMPARQFMTSSVLTIQQDYAINEAAEQMLTYKVRHLIVVDHEGQLAGLLSEHDLTQAMTLGLIDNKHIAEALFLRTLIDTLPDLVWLKDTNGVYLACNKRFERFFGSNEKSIVGKTDYDFVDKSLADFFREQDRKAMEKNGPSTNEEWVTFAEDGHRELLETIKTPMRDSKGRVIGVLGIAHDISERKRFEQALEESELRYRILVERSPLAIQVFSPEGKALRVNQAWEKMWGIPFSSLSLYNVLQDKQLEEAGILPLLKKAFSGESVEFPIHRYDKAKTHEISENVAGDFWLRAFAYPVHGPAGNLLEVVVIQEDVTKRKLSEEVLRESEEKLRGLYELSPLGIALTDMNGHYVEFNEAFRRICGYSKKELNALDYWALTPKKYQSEETRQLESLAASGRYGPYKKEYIRKDGSLIPLNFNGVLVTGRDGTKYIWSIVEDITESNRAAEMLRENEAKFRLLFETAGDGIFLQNATGFIDCNEKLASLYGFSRKEIIGRSPADLAPKRQPDGRLSAEVAGEKIAAAMKGKPQQFEWRALRADGIQLDVEITLNRLEFGGNDYLQAVVRDITGRKLAEQKLQQSEAHFRFVTESAQAMIWMSGLDKLCTWFNKVWLDFSGRTMEQELGDGWAEGVHPDDLKRCFDIYSSHFDKREPFSMEYRLKRHDGEYRWIVDNGSPRFNSQGDFEGYIGSCFDITDRKRNEESLRITASVFDNTQEAILITDANNLIVDVNPAFTRISGYSHDEAIGKNPRFLSSGRQDKAFYKAIWQSLNENKSWRGEIWNRRKSGEIYAEMLSINAICDDDGKVQRYVAVFSDISHLKEHEAELRHVAHYDALTGIPNRVLLADRIKQAIFQTERENKIMAVCYLDLDGFKPVNDTLGHAAGDQVLIEVSRRIEKTIRGGDTVARIGGDEFVVLLLGLNNEVECVATLERLLAAISAPVEFKDASINLGASIGVSIYPKNATNPDTLLRYADQAMYTAKQSGKNRFHFS